MDVGTSSGASAVEIKAGAESGSGSNTQDAGTQTSPRMNAYTQVKPKTSTKG